MELIHSGPFAGLGSITREIERQATTMATAADTMATATTDLRYRFQTTPTGGMSAGTVLNKLAETAEYIGEFAREFADQNWVIMDGDETEHWRKTLANLKDAATTFRRTVNLID